ncbi:MAG: hypothetical protein Kow0098_02060 [Ignavibacteriaceae bacterium]
MKANQNFIALFTLLIVFSAIQIFGQEEKNVKTDDKVITQEVKTSETEKVDVDTKENVNTETEVIKNENSGTNDTKVRKERDISTLSGMKQELYKQDPEKFREMKKERVEKRSEFNEKHGLTREEMKKEKEKRMQEKENRQTDPPAKDDDDQEDK